jgi:hypothetical protein
LKTQPVKVSWSWNWDHARDGKPAVDTLLAGHVHDSVAHFSSWPCALYDPSDIFFDKSRYLAHTRSHERQTG